MPPGPVALAAVHLPHFKRPPAAPFGPPIATQSDEAKFHPLVGDLKTTFTPMSVTDRKAVLNFRLGWLKARATATANALTGAGFASDLPSKMLPTNQSHWPLSTIGPLRGQLHFRLYLKQNVGVRPGDPELTDTADAYALVTGATVDAAAADPGATALLLLQIRCLADVYARWEVGAKLTQQMVGSQIVAPPLTAAEMLARILAFWRVEGDMSLPPENDTLDATLVGSDTPAGTPIVPLPSGRSRFDYFVNPRAHMYFVTWLAKPGPYSFQDPWTNVASPVDWSDPATAVKWADMAFNFGLAGLDIFWNADFEQNAEGVAFTSQFDWVALNWRVPTGRPIADAKTDAQNAYARRQHLLAAVSFPGPAPAVVRVAGISTASYAALAPTFSGASAEYVCSVLGESIRYMNRLTSGPVRFGAGAAARVPEMLVYLLYHAGGSQFRAILASAAAHAVLPASSSDVATKLRIALPSDFRDPTSDNGKALKNIRLGSSKNAETKGTAAWSSWGPVFGAPAVLTALDAYIRDERDTVWRSWVKKVIPTAAGPVAVPGPRANVISYDNLYRHHLNLFTGP